MVANGTITPEMIEEQAWLFTDQAFISEDILKEIKDYFCVVIIIN